MQLTKIVKPPTSLLTSRAWEMLLGGLAFLYPWSLKSKFHQIITQCLGIVLIITSYLLISKDTPWPSYIALIPVLGAYFIVIANYQNNFVINNPVSHYIGKWSYSIYVWHWPLVVFGFYFAFENWWIYGIPLSILLGFLSYQFIEKINFPRYSSWKEIYKVKPFYIFLIILACGYAVKETDGMKFHYPKEILIATEEFNNTNPYECDSGLRNRDFELCNIGNKNNIKAIIIGDSHAEAVTTALSSNINLKTEGVIAINTSACPLLADINIRHFSRSEEDNCLNINKQRFKLISSKKYKNIPIFLVARYTYYIESNNDPDRIQVATDSIPSIYFGKGTENYSKSQLYTSFSTSLTKTLCEISKTNPTYIVQPIPEIPFNVPKKIAKDIFFHKKEPGTYPLKSYLNRSIKTREIIKKSANICGARVLDPIVFLCKAGRCIYSYNNRPIYRDGDHLSEYGNKLLIPMFKYALDLK